MRGCAIVLAWFFTTVILIGILAFLLAGFGVFGLLGAVVLGPVLTLTAWGYMLPDESPQNGATREDIR